MTDWVVQTAARQLASWQANGLDLQLSVNISASNLEDPSFVDRILAIIRITACGRTVWNSRSRKAPS